MQTLYGSIWYEHVENVLYTDFVVLFRMKLWKVFCIQTLYGFIWHENVESILYADFVQFYLA